MAIAISPNFRDTNFPTGMSLEQKIDVFSDRVEGWQIRIAQQCADNIPHSGFAVLHIVFSYFEMIAKYQDGFIEEGKSEKYFNKGFASVFPNSPSPAPDVKSKILKKLFKDVWCGLYHSGITGPNIELSGDFFFSVTFVSPPDKIQINPHKLVPDILQHFQSYIIELRDPTNTELRQNFAARFGMTEKGSHH